MYEAAKEKLSRELANFKGDNKATAVKKHVYDALLCFARQENEFAQAIVQHTKSLSDCCTEIMKSVGSAISDMDVYKRAAAFYFPGAGVKFSLEIDLCAEVSAEASPEPSEKRGPKHLKLDLADLL